MPVITRLQSRLNKPTAAVPVKNTTPDLKNKCAHAIERIMSSASKFYSTGLDNYRSHCYTDNGNSRIPDIAKKVVFRTIHHLITFKNEYDRVGMNKFIPEQTAKKFTEIIKHTVAKFHRIFLFVSRENPSYVDKAALRTIQEYCIKNRIAQLANRAYNTPFDVVPVEIKQKTEKQPEEKKRNHAMRLRNIARVNYADMDEETPIVSQKTEKQPEEKKINYAMRLRNIARVNYADMDEEETPIVSQKQQKKTEVKSKSESVVKEIEHMRLRNIARVNYADMDEEVDNVKKDPDYGVFVRYAKMDVKKPDTYVQHVASNSSVKSQPIMHRPVTRSISMSCKKMMARVNL